MTSQQQTSSSSNAAVLKHDWDLLPDTADRFFHLSHPYDKEQPAVEAEGALLLLTDRWRESWKTEGPSTAIPPHPAELVEVARHMLGPMRDLSRPGPSHIELLDKASLALARGLWEADPEQLRLAYVTARELGGNAHSQIYAVGATSEPFVNRLPDALLSGTDHGEKVDPAGFNYTEEAGRRGGAKVTRLTLFFLEALAAVNQRIRDLASSGRTAAGAAGPGARGQLSHLIEEVLRSAMTGHTLKVNAEILEALTRSPDPRDQARVAAFWQVYPDVQRAADQGLLAPPAILSMKQGVMGNSDRLDIPAVRREPPAIDERQPWATFAERSPEAIQILDRAKGTLTIALTDDRAPYTKTITFEPWQPEDGEAARLRQDQTLRWIEEFSVTHFSGTWNLPDHLVMEDGRLKAGRLTLAEHAPEGWRLRRPAIREAAARFAALWAYDEPPLSTWLWPTPPLDAPPSTGTLDKLFIVLQVAAEADMQDGSLMRTAMAPDATIWIQMDSSGESRVVHGASLAALVGPATSIKLMVDGHGFRVWNGGGMITLGSRGPEDLARATKNALRSHGISQALDEVVLLACALESSAADTGFSEPFLRSAHEMTLVTPAATVTAYRHLMTITEAEGRTSLAFQGQERRHRAADVTMVYQRHAGTGEITVRDKYPAMLGEASWTPPWHRRAPFRHAPLIKVAPKGRQVLAAMPNPGLFDLVVRELQRHLPRFDAVREVDPAPIDAAIASLWSLLAHDAEVAAQASPEAARQSAIRRIEAEFGRKRAAEARALVREAGESLVAGLREVDPLKLYDAYLKTAAAYEITRGTKPERLELHDVASGWFATESDLELRHRPELRRARVVQRDGMAFVVALSDAMRTLESSAAGKDGARTASARVMEQIVRATVLREPFLIDADAVTHMAASSAPADQYRLNALRTTYLMQQRLARRGLTMAPEFVSMLPRDAGEWRELPGGQLMVSDADLLSALSGPLPPPLPLRDADAAIDPEAPLRGLTGGRRDLEQTLDREQGRIDIELSNDIDSAVSSDGRRFKSSVFFDALPVGATPEQRLQQDRQIRQLDDFIRAHFNRIIDRPEDGLPPEIRLKDHEILVGTLRVATEKDGRWTSDAEAISRAVAALQVHDRSIAPFDGTRGRLDRTKPWASKPVQHLTLVLQMEDDGTIAHTADRLVQKHPSETAWVQLNRDGGFKIVAGDELIRGLASKGLIKLVIVGHGTRLGNLDESALAGYSAQALALRVNQALRELRLPRRVDHTTLFSCVLEAPVFPRSFGGEFLLAADEAGFLRPDATATAYAEFVGLAFGKRSTRPAGDAPWVARRPETTFTFHIDRETETVVRKDKYPALSQTGITETPPHVDVDVLLESVFSADADATRQPGQAGKLFEMLSTLKATLKKAAPDVTSGAVQAVLLGETPDAITAAVRHLLEKTGGKLTQAGKDLLPGAATLIADGLWRQDPDLLYDGFTVLSRAHDTAPTEVRSWQVDDRPMGVVDKVRMPSGLLTDFPGNLALPSWEYAFMDGVEAGVLALEGLTSGISSDPVRVQLGRQTLALLQATLSGRPFTVDTDHLSALAASGTAADRARLRVLEIVHGVSMKLARKGVMQAPVYMTDFPQDADTGWESHGDGSRIHRGDLLPDLLPGRQAQVTRARTEGSVDFDEGHPLSRVFAFMPDAKQKLDREAGTITIVWGRTTEGRQADSVLRFTAADAIPGSHSQRVQEAQIRAMDEFLVGAFFDSSVSSLNGVPGDLTFDGSALTAGRATLARRSDGRWTPDPGALLQHWSTVGTGGRAAVSSKPASSWAYDLNGLRWPAGTAPQGPPSRLLVLLQMEDDGPMLRYARRSILRQRNEVVWIQVDGAGNHVIRWGERLLREAAADLPVKIEIAGHGGHDVATRSQTLSGYLSTKLVDHLAPVLEQLKLKGRAERVTLLSCALETPSVHHSFGSQFLDHAISTGMVRGNTALVAYGEQLRLYLEPGEETRSRDTRRHVGAEPTVRAPEVTWVFTKDPETLKIIRTDKYPASQSDSYGIEKIGTVEWDMARNLQPGRAGPLSELFATLAATQAKGGIPTIQGPAPKAMVDAVRGHLASLLSELRGIPASGLSDVATLIADGIWQRRPAKVYDGYVKLSELSTADSRYVFSVDWSDLPMGVVDRVRLPSKELLKFARYRALPLPDAALVSSMQAAVTAMAGLDVDRQPDAVGRSFARQTLALVEANLSGRPFVVDADAVFRMSTSQDANDRAALDVLDVVHATSMQLARRNVMQAPIYLTDVRDRPDVGWEAGPDGSLVHRGDLLTSLLPERQASIDTLRTPANVPFNDERPLSRLASFMPQATQTLDRETGTLRIVWPEMKDGRQADSVLKFRPSDAGLGTEGRRLQDADIVAIDDFIIGEFFPSAGPMRNALPGELTLQGDRLLAGRSELAMRKEGRWVRDDAAMREALAILAPKPSSVDAAKPVTAWYADPGDALRGADIAGVGARLLVHLQMEADPVMLRGALRTIRSHPDQTVWIQVDRNGEYEIRHGADLLKQAGSELPVKIEISGHGSHDHATRQQRLAGSSADALADRVAKVIKGIGLESRASNLTLVSCAIETPVVAGSFGETFMAAAIDKGIVDPDATMVAYGETLIRSNVLEGKQPSRNTRRYPGATPENHKLGVTWEFRMNPETLVIERTDKHLRKLTGTTPGAGAEVEVEVEGGGEVHGDDAWDSFAEHLDEEHGRTRATAVDDLTGRTLRLYGMEMPADFLASLGAQLDGEPLTSDLLRSIVDLPGDPWARLKIDSELFEQWTALLSDQPDAEIADRLQDVGEWLRTREMRSGAGSAFIDEPSANARAIADRLKAASIPDADGVLPSDADLLKAARGPDAAPTSLLGEILQDLTPKTRQDFESWAGRNGVSIDDLATMPLSKGSHLADTPIEKVAREIGRRADAVDGIDFAKIQGLSKRNALAGLQEIGVVTVDSGGLRVDAVRLQAFLESGEGMSLAYVGRALRKLSGRAYESLVDSSPDSVRPFMQEQRDLPSASGISVAGVFDKMDDGLDFVDTLVGIYQIIADWDQMSHAMRGLSVTQTLSIVVSPLAMMAGQALSTLGPVARSGVLRAVSAGLAGGVANVAFAAMGVASCVMQWQGFMASGQSFDSHAGKSLIFSTTMTAISTALAVSSAVVGTAVFVAGGAAAVAGTALGVASAILGQVAAPVAVAMFVINAVVQAALWFQEYGQYMRDSTSLGDKILAGMAKAFGVSTDVTLRAETEMAARESAIGLARSIEAQQQELLEFRVEVLSKQGYDVFFVPEIMASAKHAVFKNETATKLHDDPYVIALQPLSTTAKSKPLRITRNRKGMDLQPGTAWMSLGSHFDWHRGPITIDTRDERSRQLFEMEDFKGGAVHGGQGDEIYQLNEKTRVDIFGGGGDDEVRIDAAQGRLTIEFEPFSPVDQHSKRPLTRLFPFESAGSDPSFYVHYETDGTRSESRIVGVHRIDIRNAETATVTGSEKDERFDVSAREATIRGLKGRNTYLIRNDNRIFVTSNDAAVWSRGVSGASVDLAVAPRVDQAVKLAGSSAVDQATDPATVQATGPAVSLLLKIDVLHEALSFRREGQDLVLVIGKESLTLTHYFDRIAKAGDGAASVLTIVDALDTSVMLLDPQAIGGKTVSSAQVEKIVSFGKGLSASRRTLSGDSAYGRVYLPSGGGDFRVDPMTSSSLDLVLDVDIERLRLRADGDDLLVVEVPEDDAGADYSRLRVRLPGWERLPAHARPSQIGLWAKGQDKTIVPLVFPEGPVEEPLSFKTYPQAGGAEKEKVAPQEEAAAKDEGASPAAEPKTSEEKGKGGTHGDDVIDARGLSIGSRVSGGDGTDVYRISSGQSIKIDNAARDRALDVLRLHGIDEATLLAGIKFSWSGKDLVIHIGGGEITVLDHAAGPYARHLSLQVDEGRRFALPLLSKGWMVHRPSADEHVLATARGKHLVVLAPDTPWQVDKAPKTVRMQRPDRWLREGASVEAESGSGVVLLLDYHDAPHAWRIETGDAADDEAGITAPKRLAVPAGVARIGSDLLAGKSGAGASYPLADVRAYLKGKGMPEDIAADIDSMTLAQLQRVHALLAAAADGQSWLPASFVNGFAASEFSLQPRHGLLLRHLASRGWSWDGVDQVLLHDLSREAVGVYEAWAVANLKEGVNSAAALAGIHVFSDMLAGRLPSTYLPGLLVAVLRMKGRPAGAAETLALAMEAAGTMDDGWVAGMMQAGVAHHDVLARLWEAQVSPQDVVLGNANRRRYEGSADRSALIDVEASDTFREPVTTAYRYVSKYYLALNDAGDDFTVKDEKYRQGVKYDLFPITVVGAGGEVPKEHPDTLIARHAKATEVWRRKMNRRQNNGYGDPDDPLPPEPLPAVVALYKKDLVDVEQYEVGGGWDGRSQPQNLVDGFKGHDEVVAWRPGTASASDNAAKSKLKPIISLDPGKYIQFDFAHPIALNGLTLTEATSPSSPVVSIDDLLSPSRWKVEAQRSDGRWIDVAPAAATGGMALVELIEGIDIDTNGVPYSHYRLTGVSGTFPREDWFSEVAFTTAEAGAGPRPVVDALQDANFSDEDIRSLFLLGLRGDAQAKRAIDLRRHFGSLPPAALMEDVQGHDSLDEEEIRILNDVRASWSDQRLRSSEAQLKAVRIRSAGRNIDLLNARLPFFDVDSIEDDEHREFVAQMKEALSAKRGPSAEESRQRATSHRMSDAYYFRAEVGLVEKMRDTLRARDGEAKSRRVTKPWFLHMEALHAAAFDRTLELSVFAGTTDSVMEHSLPRLQTLTDQGVLDVAFISPMPPVGASAPWKFSIFGKGAYVSPGIDLVAELREGHAGLPIPRLMAGGFTKVHAKAMVERGIETMDQVTRAIQWRKLFKKLSWEIIAEDVLQQRPFDDEQLKLANYLSSVSGWERRPEASAAAIRDGLTPAQRTELIGRLLPDSAPGLTPMSMLWPFVTEMKLWLHDAQSSDPLSASSSANSPIALRLAQAAGGMNGGLRDAIELAAMRGLSSRGKSTVVESAPWAPQLLWGFASLSPAKEGATTEVSFDAPLHIVLATYERLLEALGKNLREKGKGVDAVAEALRSKYFDLAVLRAAASGHQLRLHVPPGESSQELGFTAMIEKRLAALQQAEEAGLLNVTVASPMPPADALEPWATEVVDGKTWHLVPDGKLEDVWRSGKTAQAIPRLMAAGYSREDARALYELKMPTQELLERALLLREHFGELPLEVVTKDVEAPLNNIEDAWFWQAIKEIVKPAPAELLTAVRANTVQPPPEWLLDSVYLPAGPSSPGLDIDIDSRLPAMVEGLSKSFEHFQRDKKESVETVARHLLQAAGGDNEGLHRALLHVQWWHIRRGLQSTIAMASPRVPEKLRGVVSIGQGEATDTAISTPTAIVLGAFERLLDTLAAEMAQRGGGKEQEVRGLDGQYLRLAALRTAASGQQLRLHVPAGGSPVDWQGRSLIEAALPVLEKARRDGVVDVAIVTSGSLVAREEDWTSQEVEGKTLHVSLRKPLDVAWRQGLLGHPFHRLVAAGYGEDDAQALHDRGIQTAEHVDRAIQLRGFFGGLPPEVVLKDVLDNPPLTDLQVALAQRFHWRGEIGMPAVLKLVRTDPKDDGARAFLVSNALAVGSGAQPYYWPNEEEKMAYEANLRGWLADTQGPEWAANEALVTAFVTSICHAAMGSMGALTSAFGIARQPGFLSRGEATKIDQREWMTETVGRHAKLWPSGDVDQPPAMAASDYIVLQGFKRLLDAVFFKRTRHSNPSSVENLMSASYLQFQILRAAATGQRIELQQPVGEYGTNTYFLARRMERLREPLGMAQSAGLIKVNFLPEPATETTEEGLVSDVSDASDVPVQDDAAKRAAEDAGSEAAHGIDSTRQAKLLMQEMAGQEEAAFGGTSSFGLPSKQSAQAMLTAQMS